MPSRILPKNFTVICVFAALVVVFWADTSTAVLQAVPVPAPAAAPLVDPNLRAFQDSRPVPVSQDDLVKPGTGGPFKPPPPESSPAFYIKARPGQRIPSSQARFFDKPNVNLRGLG